MQPTPTATTTKDPIRSRSPGLRPVLLVAAALLVSGCVSVSGEWVDESTWDVGRDRVPAADAPAARDVPPSRDAAPAGDAKAAQDGQSLTTPPATQMTRDDGSLPAAAPTSTADAAGAGELSERQRRILQAAEDILSSQNFVVNGYRYSYDCTGTILAIYAMADVRLIDLFPRYSGNGVQRLYGIAEDYELLYHTTFPQPGDLIFWDNTYDKNGDKQWNDWLTHVGLVLAVEPNGTIEYLHHDYTKGVVRARMNLTDPETYMDDDGIIVNSPMRMRSHRYLNEDQWLASHLYRRLGAMYEIDL